MISEGPFSIRPAAFCVCIYRPTVEILDFSSIPYNPGTSTFAFAGPGFHMEVIIGEIVSWAINSAINRRNLPCGSRITTHRQSCIRCRIVIAAAGTANLNIFTIIDLSHRVVPSGNHGRTARVRTYPIRSAGGTDADVHRNGDAGNLLNVRGNDCRHINIRLVGEAEGSGHGVIAVGLIVGGGSRQCSIAAGTGLVERRAITAGGRIIGPAIAMRRPHTIERTVIIAGTECVGA